MKTNNFLILCLLGLLAFSSCGKDEDKPSERTNLLSKSWRTTAVLINGDTVIDPILSSLRISFAASGTYNMNFAGSARTGSWEWANSENNILLDKSASRSENWKVLELGASSLKVETEDASGTIQYDMVSP